MPRLRLEPPRLLVHGSLAAIVLVWLLPTVGLFLTSLRPRSEIASSGWWTIAWDEVSLDNYGQVLGAQGMGGAFLNSVLITVPATALTVFLAALAGYGFAWGRFRGRDTLLLIVIGLMVVPLQTLLVPVLRLFNTLGVTGTLPAIWIAHLSFGMPLGIFLLRNFFAALPGELFEAARMDGANAWQAFVGVALPLSVPAIAAFTIFQFMWVWNDLLVALVIMNNPQTQPMTVRISALLGTYATEWHIMSSAAFISMAVPLIVFFSLQRFFITGITAGAVKG